MVQNEKKTFFLNINTGVLKKLSIQSVFFSESLTLKPHFSS